MVEEEHRSRGEERASDVANVCWHVWSTQMCILYLLYLWATGFTNLTL